MEGWHRPVAKIGYGREGKKDKPRNILGLVCNAQGCPMAVEVFAGNVADPMTLSAQIQKLQERFGLGSLAVATL